MPQARRRYAAARLLGLFAAIGAGCSDRTEHECANVRCPDGHRCNPFNSGQCEPTCEIVQCGLGDHCEEAIFGGGRCVTGCTTNEDCPAHTYCPTPNSCWSSGSCEEGPQCKPGCRDNAECLAGQFCQAGSCIKQCWADSDCWSGHVCVGGEGVAFLERLLADDGVPCAPGEQCSCFDCSAFSTPTGACAALDGGSDGAAIDGGATDGASGAVDSGTEDAAGADGPPDGAADAGSG
jgi:hypothetical protein